MGLKGSERIAKVVVDPSDTDTVYVCVPGRLWSDSEERSAFIKPRMAGKRGRKY